MHSTSLSQQFGKLGSRNAPPLERRREADGYCSTLSCLSGQTGKGDCTFFKGTTSGKWQLMATSRSPTHCRKGGLGCHPTLRQLQCLWRMETSTSSKVLALGQMRPREGRCPTQSQKTGRHLNSSRNMCPQETLPGDCFSGGLGR